MAILFGYASADFSERYTKSLITTAFAYHSLSGRRFRAVPLHSTYRNISSTSLISETPFNFLSILADLRATFSVANVSHFSLLQPRVPKVYFLHIKYVRLHFFDEFEARSMDSFPQS